MNNLSQREMPVRSGIESASWAEWRTVEKD